MTTDHGLGLRRTIDGRKQGRRFKTVSANETRRVRTDCFVRLQSVSDRDYCDLRKPLCHLYIYNRHSGSLKAHFDVILATTVSYFAAKTSQWSRQSYQKCSDARKSFKKLASRTGRRHFVQDESSDARFRSQKFASKAIRQHFGREGHSDARESRKKLASRTGRRHYAQDESSDARFRSQKLASKAGRRHFVREGRGDARESRKKLASRQHKDIFD
jgi:hypothetical protein